MNYKTASFFILIFLSGCQDTGQKHKNEVTYFDLKDYIEKESIRLSGLAPLITKTVAINGAAETRKVSIADWDKELESFKDADINKAAWKGMFNITRSASIWKYTTDNEKIPVKELTIFFKKGSNNEDEVSGLQVIVKNVNILYDSTDTLSYYPDSIYQVKKEQNILLLSKKNYQVTGNFR